MAIGLTPIGRYESGIFDESAAEIVAHDPGTQRLFVVNANNAAVDVLDIGDPTNPTLISTIDVTSIGAGANSVAVANGVVAVAVENEDEVAPGTVAFFDANGSFLNSVTVGVLPDMVTFTPDGQKVLVANEGEPGEEEDPEGSISIIDISGGVASATVMTADFTAFNGRENELRGREVRIFPDKTVAEDLEPEYIAVSPDGSTAFVALQENNAIARVNIGTATVEEIIGLGYKDHSLPGNTLDASDEDGAINLQNWPVFGMFMPDSIASFEANGQAYYVTANEGDARDEDARVADLTLDPTAFPNPAALQEEGQLGRLEVSTINGDIDGDGDYDRLFAYGGRSFTIWDQFGDRVYDSGDDFGRITAQLFPEIFNSNGNVDTFDSRSDAKGAEPEAIATGVVDGSTYAFIGLERIGGIMVYNVSNPTAPNFVQYINPNEVDIGPEGLEFIAAADSPNGSPLLAVGNEVSGTTTLYQINPAFFDLDNGSNVFTVTAGLLNQRIGGLRSLDGDDAITGSASADLINGNLGNDSISGDGGDDILFGGQNDDVLNGGEGADTINGNLGNDTISGGSGDDILFGGQNDDVLNGGEGNDVLYGDLGSDTITGGAGNDTFVLRPGGGNDAIADFQDGVDSLGLRAGLSFEQLSIVQGDGATFIDLGAERLVTLNGVQANAIGADDFAILG
ncbi:MAG: calcium-binding protein [Oscillatoria sp. SIO1A7]|nr:calcium-binding protein [Oscillatoria sp. SIO1A7]